VLGEVLYSVSLPGVLVQVVADTSGVPPTSPLAGKVAVAGNLTAYVCAGMSCSAPVTEPEALQALLRDVRRARRRVQGA
jgi:uncharacterized protein YyaL (SSP411 family)